MTAFKPSLIAAVVAILAGTPPAAAQLAAPPATATAALTEFLARHGTTLEVQDFLGGRASARRPVQTIEMKDACTLRLVGAPVARQANRPPITLKFEKPLSAGYWKEYGRFIIEFSFPEKEGGAGALFTLSRPDHSGAISAAGQERFHRETADLFQAAINACGA